MTTAKAAQIGNPKAVPGYILDTTSQTANLALTMYRQAARFGLEGAETWIDTVFRVVPGRRSVTGRSQAFLEGWVSLTFDIAEGMLKTQRELATQATAGLLSGGGA